MSVLIKPGEQYGRLTVIEAVLGGQRCRCECGGETVVVGKNLRSGSTRSCGCLRREKSAEAARRLDHPGAKPRHGHRRKSGPSRTYYTWVGMRSRCRNPNATGYARYGGRGITVCGKALGSKGRRSA